MCTQSVQFGLDQALHHLLCMRTGKPMPYIIKAKWYVRTVCSHRHSSGGNSSCMAPTDVNLFWALSICHQCPTCSAAWKFERKIYWSFPTAAAPSQPTRLEVSRSDHSAASKETASWRALRQRFGLTPVRPGCSLFLATFPSFSLWPTPIDRVSPNRCLKARHKAVSFEAAEWSEQHLGGWAG